MVPGLDGPHRSLREPAARTSLSEAPPPISSRELATRTWCKAGPRNTLRERPQPECRVSAPAPASIPRSRPEPPTRGWHSRPLREGPRPEHLTRGRITAWIPRARDPTSDARRPPASPPSNRRKGRGPRRPSPRSPPGIHGSEPTESSATRRRTARWPRSHSTPPRCITRRRSLGPSFHVEHPPSRPTLVASHPPGPASGRLTQGSRASNPPDPRPCLAFPIATSWSPPAASPTAGPTADRPEPTPLPPADPDHAADPDPAISRFRQLAATPPRLLRSDSRTLPPSERSATRRPRAPVRTSNDAVFVCHAPRETRNATAFRARARPKTRELSRRGDHRIVPAAPAPVPRGHELTRAWTLRQAHPAVDAPLEPVTTGRLAASAPRATSIRPAPSHHHRGPASARASRGVSTHHRARHARRAGVQALLCRASGGRESLVGRPGPTTARAAALHCDGAG